MRPASLTHGAGGVNVSGADAALDDSGAMVPTMCGSRRSRRRLWPTLLLSGTALIAAGAASAAADALSEARKLEAALGHLSGLVATFTQTVESPGLPSPQVEKGTVYLLRPGRMRWEYETPPGKLAIADGTRAYLYLPDDRQAVVTRLDLERPGQGMPLLLRERLDLEREFEIAWGPGSEKGDERALQLRPRVPDSEYEYLLVQTDEDHSIRELTVVDSLGSRITYRFDHIRKVSELEESLFRFVAPEGVELQELDR
jgi:outer membrane lipoprotein carrier protein